MPRTPEPRCRKCDYLLYGKSLDDTCPECGLPVVQSFGGWRVSRRASVVLVIAGFLFATLMIGSFFAVWGLDSFGIFNEWYIVALMASPSLASGAALICSSRGVRFHWVAVLLFLLSVLLSTLTVLFLIAAAAASV